MTKTGPEPSRHPKPADSGDGELDAAPIRTRGRESPATARAQPVAGLVERRLLKAHEHAIAANPTNATAHAQRGAVLIRLGRHGEAEAALRRALELRPRGRIWMLLADALKRQGRFSAAARALERAIAMGLDVPEAREQLALQLFASRRWLEAARLLVSMLASQPRPDLASKLDIALARLAEDAEAGVPPSLRAGFREAEDALLEGRPADAETWLRPVVERQPSWPQAWLALRSSLEAQGRRAEAEALGAQWRAAAPKMEAVVATAMARPLGPRGLVFDPRVPVEVKWRRNSLDRAADREALKAKDDVFLILHRGGSPVRREPIISVEADGSDVFAVQTETSPSFVAAFSDAALVGRGLVLTRNNQAVFETMLVPHEGSTKYDGEIRGRQIRFDPYVYADGDLPVQVFEEPAFLMTGPTDGSFGDWIWRYHPRLALAKAAGLDVPLVVSRHIPQRQLDMLQLSGFDRSRLLFHDPAGVSVFRRLYVPGWPTPDRIRPMKGWNEVYAPFGRAALKQALRAEAAGEAPPRLLYLSRARIPRRVLVNEAEVEQLFKDRGFAIVHPQDLSFQDVLRTFARPRVVAGPYGSALRNLAFSGEKPLGLVLMPPCDETFMRGSALWLAEMGIRFAHVPGRPAEQGGEGRWNDPWTVDLARVERAIDKVLALAEAAPAP